MAGSTCSPSERDATHTRTDERLCMHAHTRTRARAPRTPRTRHARPTHHATQRAPHTPETFCRLAPNRVPCLPPRTQVVMRPEHTHTREEWLLATVPPPLLLCAASSRCFTGFSLHFVADLTPPSPPHPTPIPRPSQLLPAWLPRALHGPPRHSEERALL